MQLVYFILSFKYQLQHTQIKRQKLNRDFRKHSFECLLDDVMLVQSFKRI